MRLNKYLTSLTLALLVSFSLSAQDFFTEDFDGGIPADWTITAVVGNGAADENWFWTDSGPGGPFSIDPIVSTSAANGWAIFDSDLNCNIGVGQDAWLISPAIDASGESVVWLTFETYYQNFYDFPQVRVGTDLGNMASWDTIAVFPDIEPNEFGGITVGDESINPQMIAMNLTDLMAGESQVYFAFQFRSTTDEGPSNLIGCAYSWQIDDVVLTSEDLTVQNDMRVNTWRAQAPNTQVPVSQLEPIGFMADIENAGVLDQDNVVLTMTVENSSGTVVYQDSVEYGTVAAGTLVENVFFDSEFTPPAGVLDTYTGTYSISYDNDAMEELPFNNELAFSFDVTEQDFAKETGFTVAFSGLEDSYTYGNVFYIPNGGEVTAENISFAINNADDLVGLPVTTLLYEWQGDMNDDLDANQDEYTIVGFSSYVFDGTETQTLVTVPANDDDPVVLQDDTYYIAAVQFASSVEGQTVSFLASDLIDYAGTWFYTDSLDKPRYTYAIDNGNEGTFSLGFDIAPVVRLSIDGSVSTSEVQLPNNAVRLFPNPVDETATLDFNLETAVDVTTTVFNLKGQVINTQNWSNVDQQQVQLPAADLPSGTYLIRVDSELGVRTLKMIVQH